MKFDIAKRFEEILAKLEEEDRRKMDVVVSKSDMHVEDDGRIFVDGLGRVAFTPHGFAVFNKLLGIPTDYAKRCMDADPRMWAEHARHWMRDDERINPDREFLVRAKRTQTGTVARAFLSPKYREIDDFPIAKEIVPFARESGAVPQMFNQTYDFMDLRLTFPDMKRSLGRLNDGSDDWCFPAIHVRNSEVGRSSVQFTLVIHRIVCSNGLVIRNREYRTIKRHYGRHVDVVSMMSDAIGNLSGAFELYVQKAREAKEITVDPEKELETLAERFEWTKRQRKAVEDAWKEEPGKTRRHIVEAITAAARGFGWTTRLEMERQAGEVLGV